MKLLKEDTEAVAKIKISDLSTFLDILDKKGVSVEALPDYLYQINDAIKLGLSMANVEEAIVRSRSADDLSRQIYDMADKRKYKELYAEGKERKVAIKEDVEDDEDWDDDAELGDDYDWYESGADHPLLGVFEEAVSDLNCYPQVSCEGPSYGIDELIDVDTDKVSYTIDWGTEVDFMNNLWYEIEDEKKLKDPKFYKSIKEEIKNFILEKAEKNLEEKVISEAKKKKDKKDLTRLPGMFINRDAGDVEAGVKAFNSAMDTGSPMGAMAETLDGKNSKTDSVEKRSKKDLDKLLQSFHVEGPDYYGAPYPPFNKEAVNESEFPERMRLKFWAIDSEDDDTVVLNWVTQEPFSEADYKKFKEEVIRCFKELMKKADMKEPITLKLDVEPRDGKEFGYIQEKIIVDIGE